MAHNIKELNIHFKFVCEDFPFKQEPDETLNLTVKPSLSMHEMLRSDLWLRNTPISHHQVLVDDLVNSCVLIYDQTILEWKATPVTAGMGDGDTVLVLEKSFFSEEKFKCLSAKKVDIIHNFFKEPKYGIWSPLIPMLTECRMGHPNSGDQATCGFIMYCILTYLIPALKKELQKKIATKETHS